MKALVTLPIRWFESSIAHSQKTLICWRNAGRKKGPDSGPARFDNTEG